MRLSSVRTSLIWSTWILSILSGPHCTRDKGEKRARAKAKFNHNNLDETHKVRRTHGQGSSQPVETATERAQPIQLGADGAEEESEVHGVRGRAGVVLVARVFPVQVQPVEPVRLDEPDALLSEGLPPRGGRRDAREVVAEGPPPDGGPHLMEVITQLAV